MALTWITWPQLLLISVFTLQMFAVSDATSTPITNTTITSFTTPPSTSGSTMNSTNNDSANNETPDTSTKAGMTSSSTDISGVGSSHSSTTAPPTTSASTSMSVSTSRPASSTSTNESSSASFTTDTTTPDDISTTTTFPAHGSWQWFVLLIGVPSAGGVILLVVIIVVIVVCCRRRKRRKAADEESKALERVTAPNGDLYTQVMVKGRGFQAIEMTPMKASNGCGHEYKRLSMDVPSDVSHNARSTKGTKSAIITSIDYESMTELNLGGENGHAKETKVCRESGEAQPMDKVDEGVRESAYINPLAEGGNEVEYENCSDFLNVNGGDGKVSIGATETKKSTKTPPSEVTIVPLKKNKSPMADKKEKSLKSPSRDAPSTVSNTAEKPSAQDENSAAPGESRPESDVYENASVVHAVKQGSMSQEATPDPQATQDSKAADDVMVAKEVEAPQSPASKDSSEDWLEDNILYESSRDVSLYMNKAAGD